MWHVRKEIKWNHYWKLTALWEWKYTTTPKWKDVILEKCVCECWNEKRIRRTSLLNWKSTSCWCRVVEIMKWKPSNNRIHWMARSRFYKIYYWIKDRCNNHKNNRYYRYWWRWIKCLRCDFESFYNDMGNSYKKHVQLFWETDTTIERIDADWNYCKENCRWATNAEQQNNRSNNRTVLYKWTLYPSIRYMCNVLWLNYNRVYYRIKHWWDTISAVEK